MGCCFKVISHLFKSRHFIPLSRWLFKKSSLTEIVALWLSTFLACVRAWAPSSVWQGKQRSQENTTKMSVYDSTLHLCLLVTHGQVGKEVTQFLQRSQPPCQHFSSFLRRPGPFPKVSASEGGGLALCLRAASHTISHKAVAPNEGSPTSLSSF